MTAAPTGPADRCWPLVVVGGGPAAARQVLNSPLDPRDVLVVADRLGGWMHRLGPSRLQSYLEELALGDRPEDVRAVLGGTGLQPSGWAYSGYVADRLARSGAEVLAGEVTDVRPPEDGGDLVVEVRTSGGELAVRARRVVLATGVRPKSPPPEWAAAGAVTFDVAYRWVQDNRVELFRDRSVLVVGTGNSAMQTAALVSRAARDVTVLAKRYLGMYPQETDDRFAWRSWSQLTYELVAKSRTGCAAAPDVVPCVRFLVYDSLTLRDGTIRFDYRAAGNDNVLGRASLPPRCRHVSATPLGPDGGAWAEERPTARTLVLWATGVEPRYPTGPRLGALPRDADGYLLASAEGCTTVPGLLVTGAAARARAVNEMACAPVDVPVPDPARPGGLRSGAR